MSLMSLETVVERAAKAGVTIDELVKRACATCGLPNDSVPIRERFAKRCLDLVRADTIPPVVVEYLSLEQQPKLQPRGIATGLFSI